MAKPLNYTDEIDVSWAITAVETIRVSAEPDPRYPVVLDLEGNCPRCTDDMQDVHWLITFSGVSSMSRDDALRAIEALHDAGAIGEPLLPAEFSVQCRCHQTHPDPLRRSGLEGCGAVWRMRFERHEET